MNIDETIEADIAHGHAIANHVYGANECGSYTRQLTITDADAVQNLAVTCENLAAELKEVETRLAEAEYVIAGMHYLGMSTAAVNASTALNEYLEKYAMKKPESRQTLTNSQ